MNKTVLATAFLGTVMAMTLTACSSNQAIKTTDGRTIVTSGKPQIDSDTGLVSYKDAQSGKTEQINRDKITNMSELDN
ncbi:YgdI/YgdR family lipoprotein [Enterobacter sp. CFBP8995]|nr:YgdI/YgdR family lipoprotein [Enterobacter sp. CFBP8995]